MCHIVGYHQLLKFEGQKVMDLIPSRLVTWKNLGNL